ncbi:MAG: hypothetical protein A2Z48_07305, partial [Actinobacteria bacterium RBG_19FT_COMBO_70_19]
MVLLVASLLTLGQSQRLRSRLIADATTSAQTLVETALTPELLELKDVAPVSSGGRYEDLVKVVDRSVLADGTVKAVTIWAADGTVVFADDASLIGDEVRAMRTTVLSVIGDEPRSDVSRGLLRSFVPVELAPGVGVAVELDRSADPIASATDPWRLVALLFAAGAVLSILLFAKTFTPYERRIEGFDEDVLRAAVAGHRRAESARQEAENRRDILAAELDRTRQTLKEAEQRAREAARTADDTPRLREHLSIAADDLKRAEQERDALRDRLVETGRAVEAEAARGREEVAGALAEIERLEAMKASLQDRAAKAEETAAELTKRLAELSARPDVEAELESAHRTLEAAQHDVAATRERWEEAERRNAELEDTVAEMHARLTDLERRPDLSAKLDAATGALDIAREHIRALTARADESDAEASKLRAELERRQGGRARMIEDARTGLGELRAELEQVSAELRNVTVENTALRDEVGSLRRASDAAGQMIAGANTELVQTAELVKTLRTRVEEAETALEHERETRGAILEVERAKAVAALEAEREVAVAAVEAERANLRKMERDQETVRLALDAAIGERDTAARQRDASAAEADAVAQERDDLSADRDALARERDALLAARDALTAERDRAHTDIQVARAEVEARAADLEAARSERDGVGAELETLRSTM